MTGMDLREALAVARAGLSGRDLETQARREEAIAILDRILDGPPAGVAAYPTREVLEVAWGCVMDDTDLSSDRRGIVSDSLLAMLEQRGCSHFDPAAETLCDLIDVIVAG